VDQAIAPLLLDCAQVRSQGACVFPAEKKRRHIWMTAHQAFAQLLGEPIQINAPIEVAKSRSDLWALAPIAWHWAHMRSASASPSRCNSPKVSPSAREAETPSNVQAIAITSVKMRKR
jgi:hypothetical protein